MSDKYLEAARAFEQQLVERFVHDNRKEPSLEAIWLIKRMAELRAAFDKALDGQRKAYRAN